MEDVRHLILMADPCRIPNDFHRTRSELHTINTTLDHISQKKIEM